MSNENPYPGVNAHLNSWLQRADHAPLWAGFHQSLITCLAEMLNESLPEPYVALIEKSKQVPSDLPEGDSVPQAVAIYEDDLFKQTAEHALCWFEVIFPHDLRHPTYPDQRKSILFYGTKFVEIELAHESPPTLKMTPNYPDQSHATAYRVVTLDPLKPVPGFEEGIGIIHGFRVGEALPKIHLPLWINAETLFDLNPVYQEAFRRGHWSDFIDYTAVPERFHTYSEDDRSAILDIMKKING
jgi:hypothetical protein